MDINFKTQVHEYMVTWRRFGAERMFSEKVYVIDGYTTVDDIPRILAMAHGLSSAHSVVIFHTEPL